MPKYSKFKIIELKKKPVLFSIWTLSKQENTEKNTPEPDTNRNKNEKIIILTKKKLLWTQTDKKGKKTDMEKKTSACNYESDSQHFYPSAINASLIFLKVSLAFL